MFFRKKKRKPKVLVFGLDGVPYGLIKDLSERGVMPTFSSLIKEGVFSEMASSIPEVSSVAWSCVITGKNPGEHGIYGFMDLRPGSYKFYFPNFNSLKARPFWEEWDNLRSAIINVPGTYPARPLNGILISGFVALDLKKATYPADLVPKLEGLGYRIDVDSSKGHKSKELLLNDIDETIDARIKALFELYEMENWDIFMFVFTETDRLMHFLWDAYEEKGNPYRDRFLEVFSKIDRAIGDFLKRVEDIPLIILSDHGFERLDYDVNVNFLLQKEGFLKFEREDPKSLEEISGDTIAFSLEPARIYLNYTGRYPKGSVREEEKEKIIERLISLFDSLEKDGKKVIKKVFKKEELYDGPCIESAPDLVLLSEKGFNLRSTLRVQALFTQSDAFTGKHSQPDAFFIVKKADRAYYVPQGMSVSEVVEVVKKFLGDRKV